MTTSFTRRSRRITAALGVAAIGAAGLFGATAAYAAPGNIDSTTIGSLNIHKHLENDSAAAKPDGSGNVTGDAVEGVEFTIHQLNFEGNAIDLSSFADWNGLGNVTLGDDCTVAGPANYSLGGPVATVTTDVQGEATYNVGTTRSAYVVCETDVSGAKVNGEAVSIVKAAAPFVTSVPMPFENEWIYNVHAYPKNSVAAIEKSIDSQPQGEVIIGSAIRFPVTTDIPEVAAGDKLSSYIVRDVLDERLTPVKVESVTVGGNAVNPDFYDVRVNATDAQDMRVVFNEAGLAWLETQGGKQVVTTFHGIVSTLGDGVIKNQATLFVNKPGADSDTTTEPGIPSNEVKSNWGDLVIQKTDEANDKTLDGATFEVYEADPAYPDTGGTCTSTTTAGSALSVNGESSFTTTGNTGKVTIPGLFVSDSENAPVNAAERCYVIVETAAPAGYILPTGDAAKTAVAVKTGVTSAIDIDVPNTKQDVPDLPLTGAAGQTIMVLGGTALLAMTVGLVMMRRRQQA